jgi:hypothetical protein
MPEGLPSGSATSKLIFNGYLLAFAICYLLIIICFIAIIKYTPTEVSLIQSNFNDPGNLEVVTRMAPGIGRDSQDVLVAYFMDSSSVNWDGPFLIKAYSQLIRG